MEEAILGIKVADFGFENLVQGILLSCREGLLPALGDSLEALELIDECAVLGCELIDAICVIDVQQALKDNRALIGG